MSTEIIEEEEMYNFVPNHKSKMEEAKYIINKAEEDLEVQEKNYIKVISLIQDKNEEINKIKNNIVDNLLPKVKQLFNNLNSDIDISKAKIFNEAQEIGNSLSIGEKPEKPNISNGIFSGLLLGLFFCLVAAGTLALFVAHKLGITIPQEHMIGETEAIKITEYIGLGFNGQEGNLFLGLGILGAIVFIVLLFFMSIISWRARSKSVRKAKNFEKEVSEAIKEMKGKEKEISELLSLLNSEKRILNVYEVLIDEYVSKAKRISVVQKIASIDKSEELKKLMKNISDLTFKLIDLINADLIENDKINTEIEEAVNSSKTIINEHLFKIYNDKNYLL